MSKFNEREKKFKRTKSSNKENLLKVYGMDDILMDFFCCYIVSTNDNIHRFSMMSLQKLMSSINAEIFATNPVLMQKYEFIMKGIAFRTEGIPGNLVLSELQRNTEVGNMVSSMGILRELTNEEVKYIEESVSFYLNGMIFDQYVAQLKSICESYEVAKPFERKPVLNKLRGSMANMMTEFRRNDVANHSTATRFRLSTMDDSVDEIHNHICNPSYRLVTGMKAFNDILGGGFQKTKLYCLFGMAGEGKTVTMVNLLYQTWKYNKGFKTKDPTKKPCICLLTMENLVIEYICSLFHVITRGGNIKDCSSGKAAIAEFKNRKFEYAEEGDIEILIDYKPVHSKDTRYMYEMVEELEDEGFETIAFFMDYLMRIRPSEYTKDPYIDLGTAANDFKTFAILKEIPVITASQLNREAAKIIDLGRNSNQADIIKKLGRTTIGDSINIDRNIDATIILVPEVSRDNQRYMAFKLTKHRYEIYTNVVSFFQPMYPQSYIAMVEDALDPVGAYRLTLNYDEDYVREFMGAEVEKVSMTNSIKNMQEKIAYSSEQLTKNYVQERPKPEYGISADKLVDGGLKSIVNIIPEEQRTDLPSLQIR